MSGQSKQQGSMGHLPPLKHAGKGLAFICEVARKNQAPKTVQFTVPKMKQVAKLAKSLGQDVTGLTVHGDGGFTVSIGQTGVPTTAQHSEWD